MKRNESKGTTLKMFNDQYSKERKIRKEITRGLNQAASHIFNKMCIKEDKAVDGFMEEGVINIIKNAEHPLNTSKAKMTCRI